MKRLFSTLIAGLAVIALSSGPVLAGGGCSGKSHSKEQTASGGSSDGPVSTPITQIPGDSSSS